MPGLDKMQPWNGPNRCISSSKTGQPCSQFEIDGLEHCFWHMPRELREEAEEITGWRYCTAPECSNPAMEGTLPPLCGQQHAVAGSPMARQAGARAVEDRIGARFMEIMSQDGERILNPRKLEDPLTELLKLGAEMRELKDMMREVVAVMKPGQWRYTGKAGEQARAEIILYERALERYHRILVDLLKLGIEERLAGVEERTLDLMERAMDAAIKDGIRAIDTGSSALQAQAKARETLRRELPVLVA